MIPMILIFTRPNHTPKYELLTFNCDNLEECKGKLIVNIKNKILKNIDYPLFLDDFASLFWYNDNYMDNEVFNYNVFYNNEWIQPWELQELYEETIKIIHQVDIQNSIYSKTNYYSGELDDSDDSGEN
jgi:hypothetical protein